MKILLAIHPGSASQAALDAVCAGPWPADSFFNVVSVIEPSHLWTSSEAVTKMVRGAENAVQWAVARLQEKGYKGLAMAVSGDPKTVILDRAASTGAELVMMGANGEPSGTVTSAVLRHAACPVEVVRATTSGGGVGMKVLLATDGSESSQRAAASVAKRPWPKGTEIRVLSVVELSLPATRVFLEPPLIDSAFVEHARVEAMKRAQDAIAGARELLAATPLTVSESISVLLDAPKAIILAEAAEWEADLIVLGSHGRRGIDRFLLGSVSEAVATHAACSVEVVR